MGFRFRRRIRLAPGININLGLGGASLSLGGPGATVNIGRKGVLGTVGIPGSGLSYSEQLASFGKRKTASNGPKSQSTPLSNLLGFRLQLKDDNQITAELDMGNGYQGQLADSRQWALLIQSHEQQIRDWLMALADERNHAIYGLSQLHQQIPQPGSRFNPVRPFDQPAPVRRVPEPLGLIEKLNPFAKKRYEEELARAQALFEVETREHDEARSCHHRYMQLVLAKQRLAQTGNQQAMSELLNDAFSSVNWPKETLIDFEFVSDQVLMLDVDLPEIEDIGGLVFTPNANLSGLSEKKLKVSEINQIYQEHIYGVIARIVGEAFAVLPTLDSVIISGYTQRRNKQGEVQDDYVISIGIDLETWRKIYPQITNNLSVIANGPCSRLKIQVAQKMGTITPFKIENFTFS